MKLIKLVVFGILCISQVLATDLDKNDDAALLISESTDSTVKTTPFNNPAAPVIVAPIKKINMTVKESKEIGVLYDP